MPHQIVTAIHKIRRYTATNKQTDNDRQQGTRANMRETATQEGGQQQKDLFLYLLVDRMASVNAQMIVQNISFTLGIFKCFLIVLRPHTYRPSDSALRCHTSCCR